jgi:ABC-2 type transport system permease protein
MMAIWWRLLQREQRVIRRDKNILSVLLLAPVFYAFFYGSIYMHKSEQDVAIMVVDQDQNSWSREFIRNLDAHPLIRVKEVSVDLAMARTQLDEMSVFGLVVIPAATFRNLSREEAATVVVEINTTRFLIANDINKAVNEVAEEAGRRFCEASLARTGRPRTMATPLPADLRALANTTESYGDFMLPGLLMLILQQTLFIGMAEGMGKERETASLGRWLAEAEQRPWLAVAGKGAYYFALYAGYAALFLAMHYSLFKLVQVGTLWQVATLLVLFLVAVVSWAFLLATFFSTKLQALRWSVFTSYPLFLLSGYSWPVLAMPAPMQVLAQLIPLTPFMRAFTRVTLLGAGWTQVAPELLHLLMLAAICFWLAGLRVRRLAHAESSAAVADGMA